MDHPLISVVVQVVVAYLAVAVYKCALMYSTLPIAVGAHYRALGRRGQHLSRTHLFIVVGFTLLMIAVFHWPQALLRERWSFFSAYTPFRTMKDVLYGYQ